MNSATSLGMEMSCTNQMKNKQNRAMKTETQSITTESFLMNVDSNT